LADRTRLVLADDHPIFLEGLRRLLEMEEDFEVVGEAMTGTSAYRLVADAKPDIAVLDVSLPELSGIALARRLATDLPGVRRTVAMSPSTRTRPAERPGPLAWQGCSLPPGKSLRQTALGASRYLLAAGGTASALRLPYTVFPFARIIVRVDVLNGPRPGAVKLQDRFTLGPDKVLHTG